MGTDFIEKVGATYKKGWDKNRLELGARTLFTTEPGCLVRSAVVDMIDSVPMPTVGDHVLVRADPSGLVIVDELTPTGHFVDSPSEIVDRIESFGGYSAGQVVTVHTVSRLIEVTLC